MSENKTQQLQKTRQISLRQYILETRPGSRDTTTPTGRMTHDLARHQNFVLLAAVVNSIDTYWHRPSSSMNVITSLKSHTRPARAHTSGSRHYLSFLKIMSVL